MNIYISLNIFINFQGFARYSVDTKWRVPHFEKMLYDQAQLAMVYTMAYRLTREQNYEYIARGILTYVSRDLSHPVSFTFLCY